MRAEWPIEGTSGYDFMNLVLGTLVYPDGLKELGGHYAAFTGDSVAFASLAHDKKLAVTQEALGSDVNRLAELFVTICESNREHRDFTRAELRRSIREVASCFAIYRTYIVPERNEICDEDREPITEAIEAAKSNRQDIDPSLFDFMRSVLMLETTGKAESEFVYRFQQFTSPVMAKGVEDTAFYCSNRLTAMNEVGGNPECEGFSLDEFHGYQLEMQRTFPSTMTTLSTHDTKRADDVRARLLVLSEIPDEFAAAAKAWSAMGAQDRDPAIDGGTEWFLFQTMVGAWPIDYERLSGYMQKAMREAKVRTSWVANNREYEEALERYMQALLNNPVFVSSLGDFVATINPAGRVNSLTQTLLKYLAPGVPDLYQGGELWDHSLVDPDNRRPVDYALRTELLAELRTLTPQQILARMEEGLPKLWLIHQAVTLRTQQPEWFGEEGSYAPLSAQGSKATHVLAFSRANNTIAVAPRHTLRLAGDWEGTHLTLPEGQWTNRLTGEQFSGTITLQDLLSNFPVALLVRAR